MGTDYRSDVGLAALDVDGDGWVDLVCSGVWYRNPGKPREAAFERIPFAEKAAGAHDILVADVDGDNRADVLMMGDSRTALNALCWFRIPADPRRPWVRHEIGPGIHGAITPAGAFDVDGDSDLDVTRGDTWYENRDGKGLDWQPHKNLPMGRSGPYGVCVRSAVADLDGDGRPELVVADADIAESRVAVLWNRGGKGADWRKQELPQSFRYGSLHALAVADLNGDGRPDIVVNEQEELLPEGRDNPRWVVVGEPRRGEVRRARPARQAARRPRAPGRRRGRRRRPRHRLQAVERLARATAPAGRSTSITWRTGRSPDAAGQPTNGCLRKAVG